METLENVLLQLLCRLERLGDRNEALYDSEAREQIGGLIMDGFVRRTPGFEMPERLDVFSDDADLELRLALGSYIDAANGIADEIGLTSFHDRLGAFQNSAVRTATATAVDYEDFFGHTPAEWYDADGNVLWDRVK